MRPWCRLACLSIWFSACGGGPDSAGGPADLSAGAPLDGAPGGDVVIKATPAQFRLGMPTSVAAIRATRPVPTAR